jgi:hypothetical protein
MQKYTLLTIKYGKKQLLTHIMVGKCSYDEPLG